LTVPQQVPKFFASYANWRFTTAPDNARRFYLSRDKYRTHPRIPLSTIPQALLFLQSGTFLRISDNNFLSFSSSSYAIHNPLLVSFAFDQPNLFMKSASYKAACFLSLIPY
jgi:hypothetical protein